MHQSNILFPFDQAAELRQCVLLEELSLENNKLVRPLLDFRLFNCLTEAFFY